MECRMEFCIYNLETKCILENISINEAGMCEECITVSLDRQLLAKEKERLLERLK